MGLAGGFWLESWRWVLGVAWVLRWGVVAGELSWVCWIFGFLGSSGAGGARVFGSRFCLTRWWTRLNRVLCKGFLRRDEVEVCVGMVDAG